MTRYCINCATALLPRVIERLERQVCPNCDFTLWGDPKVAVNVIIEADGKLLLGRRTIEPGLGLWGLPGGYVDLDEAPAATAVRECHEEILAAVDIESLVGVFHVPKGNRESSIVTISYAAHLAAGHSALCGPEFSQIAWFDPADLPQMAFESHCKAIDRWSDSVRAGRPADG